MIPSRPRDLDDPLTEEDWQYYKRELADFGCFYDEEDRIMRNLRIVRAEINRDRFLAEQQRNARAAERPAEPKRDLAASK